MLGVSVYMVVPLVGVYTVRPDPRASDDLKFSVINEISTDIIIQYTRNPRCVTCKVNLSNILLGRAMESSIILSSISIGV